MPTDRRNQTDLHSRWEVAHDVNNLLTAKAGWLYLISQDAGAPQQETLNRPMLARAQAELEDLVARAVAVGSLSEAEAAALVGDDIDAAARVVEVLWHG